jgi:hydrogenase maturation protein HypF
MPQQHLAHALSGATPELIRVRGQVQGVGFRPTVCRLATRLGLPGWVKNDCDGVLIALGGDAQLRARFLDELLHALPTLAHVQEVLREPLDASAASTIPQTGFDILSSAVAEASAPEAQVLPDAAVCAACAREVLDPHARRYRYPFTNCTGCGPRFTIMHALPWDRSRSCMAAFELCEPCRAEYEAQADRRYHAEPIACARCGPRVNVARSDHGAFSLEGLGVDAVDAIADLLMRGAIVALKGIGGYHLLADATQAATVERLRSRKRRPHKPFALMARDLDVVSAYCELSAQERACLTGPSAPVVLLRGRTPQPAPALAPALHPLPEQAQRRYGVMLPMSPLHLLALQRMPRPVVCTSGNVSEEPQVIEDSEAFERLAGIADWIVSHDRPIHNRVDDSVVRVVAERVRVLRRGRGLAPASLPLPPGFEDIAARTCVWAAGADLKAAVCLSRKHDLVLSQYLGDLDEVRSYQQYMEQSGRLGALFQQRPQHIALDNHPQSRAAAYARGLAAQSGLVVHEVAHHHAHFAACLGDNAVPNDAPVRLGLILDGVGIGDRADALWGCEVLVGDYAEVERHGTLLPTALLGGDRAAREPWRCLYAQLRAAFSWQTLDAVYAALPCVEKLRAKPRPLLEHMLERGLGAPHASSCGRLFDAVCAALDVCFEAQSYEAQAAQTLEALVDPLSLRRAVSEHAAGAGYALPIRDAQPLQLDPRALWPALLGDLASHIPLPLIAARFQVALAAGLACLCAAVTNRAHSAGRPLERVVALSGGCMQNAVLHERLQAELEARGFAVLTHGAVPANDGGIALGQALVALARCARADSDQATRTHEPCV